jgi:predicted esterase
LATPGYECYVYFDPAEGPNGTTFRKAVENLRNYVAVEGPFDAVLGFSQGASLGGALILDQQGDDSQATPAPFKCAIFLTRSVLFSESASTDVIRIPTLHLLGNKDEWVDGLGKPLRNCCQEQNRVVFEHSAGHEVPRGMELIQAVHRIRRTLDSGIRSSSVAMGVA